MTFAAVAIVKDEAERIGACLDSLRGIIDRYIICDTGSSDETVAVIEASGIPGRIYHLPFIDFGHNRSEALVAAYGKADWLICTDADQVWEFDPDFEPDPAVDAYMVKMGSGDFEYRLPLILNGRKSWKSVGAVHEYTILQNDTLGVRVNTDKVRVTTSDRSSVGKSEWHASLLEGKDDARSIFYLANTYRDLGRLDEAKVLYERRAAMTNTYEEERWYAQYRAALLDGWPLQATTLLAAWEARPHRLEPLYDLVAELNRRDMHRAAYGLTFSYPLHTDDVLFIHRAAWNWGLDFERSIAAWWCGEYAEAERLGRAVLARTIPDNVRGAILRNLSMGERVA